jgi:hypothetical protein
VTREGLHSTQQTKTKTKTKQNKTKQNKTKQNKEKKRIFLHHSSLYLCAYAVSSFLQLGIGKVSTHRRGTEVCSQHGCNRKRYAVQLKRVKWDPSDKLEKAQMPQVPSFLSPLHPHSHVARWCAI